MRDKSPQAIHVEFGDIQTIEFFGLFEKYAIRNANSLGMNEQEIRMLLDYWKNPNLKAFSVQSGQPTFDQIIGDIKELFKVQEERGMDISRLHIHPYGSFFMCYDTRKWEDAREAILKSAVALPKYCVNGPSNIDLDDKYLEDTTIQEMFDIDPIPRQINHPFKKGEFIETNKNTLTY